MWKIIYFSLNVANVMGISRITANMATDYFLYSDVKYVSHLSCSGPRDNMMTASALMRRGIRTATGLVDRRPPALEKMLSQWDAAVGVLVDASCQNTPKLLQDASETLMFDAMHSWLLLQDSGDTNDTTQDPSDPAHSSQDPGHSSSLLEELLQDLKLSIDADVVIASSNGNGFLLTDVFNFGRIQGNKLETSRLGEWTPKRGLDAAPRGFKYYRRWDFHNLTLRAVSVIRDAPKEFNERMLWEPVFTPGVEAMTKISNQLLNVLKEMHNFRFNYTVAGRWVGTPRRNSTLAVSNSLFWREQDISATSMRLFPTWLDWVDPFFPQVTEMETKFYYLIPDKGVGDYENQFLTPMSPGVWWCSAAAGLACALVLIIAATLGGRPEPGSYGVFSVLAAGFQQEYEDGIQVGEEYLLQSRKVALLVVGLTSMLLYNYYTSSVVSWLLNAAAPTLATLDGLINSDFELIFEDIGYTRGWLDNPGFYYYSGVKNEKEDELRAKKVTNAKRSVPLMQSVEDGIGLVRSGAYAYHTEPYTASQVIARTLEDSELCELGALQMMPPAPVYVMGQKRSPYKQFFVWSMLRLRERGHFTVSQGRVGGAVPPCSGRTPRALSLGQAAPAFLILAEATMVALIMLAAEIWIHRYQHRTH